MPEYEIAIFFYNPNIEPLEEYEKRKSEIDKLLVVRNVGHSLYQNCEVLSCEYDNEIFEQMVTEFRGEPERGVRCSLCFELRLTETALKAKSEGFDAFATTLSVSPHKNAKTINEVGCRVSEEIEIEYLLSDFKKRDGFKRSTELSARFGLYRQSYCGCINENNVPNVRMNGKYSTPKEM